MTNKQKLTTQQIVSKIEKQYNKDFANNSSVKELMEKLSKT